MQVLKYSSYFFLLLSLKSFSQPIITSNPAPIGFSSDAYAGNPINPGPSGSNITWDFHSITLDSIGKLSVVNTNATPYSSQFPNANYCIKLFPTGLPAAYDYYINDANKFEVLAENFGGAGAADDYSPNPELLLKFPFYYGETIGDSWKKTDSIGGIDSITYDGYGTLITPYGTYKDVVRIRASSGTDTTYYWYTINPFFNIFYTSQSDQTVALKSAPTEIPILKKEIFDISPNPVIDQITVKSSSQGSLILLNALGKEIAHYSVINSSTKILVSDIPTGIYFYVFKLKDGHILAKGSLIKS